MKYINSFNISSKVIPINGQTRSFTVTGNEGAQYYVVVKNGTDNKFYNFNTRTFTTQQNNVVKTIGASGFNVDYIVFPAETHDQTYTLYVNKFGAETSNNVDKNTFDSVDGTIVFGKKIYQYKDITVTISLFSANAHWATFPTAVTVTKPRGYTTNGNVDRATRFDIDYTVTMSSGNGMVISRQPLQSDFRSQKSATILTTDTDGSTEIHVDSIEGILGGSTVTGDDIGTDGLSATASVVSTKVENNRNIVVLSDQQTVTADRTLTFSNEGVSAAQGISGLVYKINSISAELQDVTTAVNGAVSSSANVTVDSSDGIIASSTTFVKGIGVVDSSCSDKVHVDAINTSSNVMTLSVAQTLPDDTPLTITGSSRTAIIKANGIIKDIGTSDITISLNLDNFLTQS